MSSLSISSRCHVEGCTRFVRASCSSVDCTGAEWSSTFALCSFCLLTGWWLVTSGDESSLFVSRLLPASETFPWNKLLLASLRSGRDFVMSGSRDSELTTRLMWSDTPSLFSPVSLQIWSVTIVPGWHWSRCWVFCNFTCLLLCFYGFYDSRDLSSWQYLISFTVFSFYCFSTLFHLHTFGHELNFQEWHEFLFWT